jgi:hypothetical protein
LIWRDNQGIVRLRVGLLQEIVSANALDQLRFSTNEIHRWTDNLVISEGDMTSTTYYQIDCRTIHPRFNSRWKQREVVFEYDPMVANSKEFKQPSFGFTPQTPPADGPLKDTYRVSLDGAPENVLEWEAIFNDTGGVSLRFITVRSSEKNSFQRKVVCDLHVPWNKDRQAFKGFTIKTTKGDLAINPHTLHEVEVVELSGQCLKQRISPLAQYTLDDGASESEEQSYTGLDVLNRYHNQRAGEPVIGETLEVTTVVFKPPHHRSLVLV